MWLPDFLNSYINNRFGSKRSMLNALKHEVLGSLGIYRKFSLSELTCKPERYVFVCAGNICRSPLAEAQAKALGANAVSFGLDTRGDDEADPRAREIAERYGLNLSSHRTTKAEWYVPEPGDLVVAMEPEHLKLYRKTGLSVPIVLLGTAGIRNSYFIADPYSTGPVFFEKCEVDVMRFTTQLVAHGKS